MIVQVVCDVPIQESTVTSKVGQHLSLNQSRQVLDLN